MSMKEPVGVDPPPLIIPVHSPKCTVKNTVNCNHYKVAINRKLLPIIYSPEYNITFWGLQKLHPFDSQKWGSIFKALKNFGILDEECCVQPIEITEEELLMGHTQEYLKSLKSNIAVARITEVPFLILMPNFLVHRKVLHPFQLQTSGTIMGARLAFERGWAINIGGGFHHCSSQFGGGFCAYADISLAIKYAFENMMGLNRVMIVDLDAHQGNGHERDFMKDPRVYILDIYNREIYPKDTYAKKAITRKVELEPYTPDETYLPLVNAHLTIALKEFKPNLVVYNAGTDILDGDPLGALSISRKGIIERDQIVFTKCRLQKVPILMVLSGGYLKVTSKVISDSIINLNNLGLITCRNQMLTKDENLTEPKCEQPCLGRRSLHSMEHLSDRDIGAASAAGTSDDDCLYGLKEFMESTK